MQRGVLAKCFCAQEGSQPDPAPRLHSRLEECATAPEHVSPSAVVMLVIGGLVPALLPALVRLVNGYKALWSHDGVWLCQRAYLFMAFMTSMRLIGCCYGLVDGLGRLQLSTLGAFYLAAPRKRRAVLADTYKSQFRKLVFVKTYDGEEPEEHLPLVPDRETSTALKDREGGFARFRCVFEANARRGKSIVFHRRASLKMPKQQREASEEETAQQGTNNTVSYLAARKFACFQLLARTDCLKLEGKSEAVMLILFLVLILVSVLLVYSVGLTDGQHYIPLSFGALIVVAVLATMLSIVNNLVCLEHLLLADTLKILQSWRERLEHLRHGVTKTLSKKDNRQEITFLDNHLISNSVALHLPRATALQTRFTLSVQGRNE